MGKKDRALHAGFPFTASGIGRSHLPAPALSHGFGGDTDAMIALSGLAWEVVIEMGMGEEERWSDDGEWNMGRKEKSRAHVAVSGEAEVGVCRSGDSEELRFWMRPWEEAI